MKSEGPKDILEQFGFDLNEGRFKILEAIMDTQARKKKPVEFDDIYSHLNNPVLDKRMSKPQIYKYITELENDGLIRINRATYRNQYYTNEDTIFDAVERLRLRKIAEIQTEKRNLEETLSTLRKIVTGRLANDLVEHIAGKKRVSKPRSAQGYDQIHRLIDTEIYENAVVGETIRLTLDWVKVTPSKEDERAELVKRILKQGLGVHVLIRRSIAINGGIAERRFKEYMEWKEKYYVKFRISNRSNRSYQGVFHNKLGIVLVISEKPLTGVWVPLDANVQLVQDAVTKFDEEFQNAVDIIEYIKLRGGDA